MPSVTAKANDLFEFLLRRFKRTVEKSGVLTALKKREYYEKPTAERKRKKAAAIKRALKQKMREQMAKEKDKQR